MTKVSVYIDDEVWEKFRRFVFENEGSFRSLSKKLTQMLKLMLSSDLVDVINEKFNQFLIEIDRDSARIDRPKNPISSAKIVREMRDTR